MKKMAIMMIVLTISFAVTAQAQLIRYEDFAPASGKGDGDQIYGSPDALVSTNAWLNSGTTVQGPRLSAGDLSYSGLQTSSDGFKAFLNNTNTATSGSSANIYMSYENQTGALYASFLLRVTDLGTVGTSWTLDGTFFHLYATADSNVVGIRDNGAGGFELRFAGLSADFTDGSPAYTHTGMSLNTTYLIVVGTDSTAASGAWKVWINPVSLGGDEPTPTSTAANWRGSAANNTSVRLGDDDSALPLPTMFVDDLRIGTTYASVTPSSGVPVPQPGSVVIIR